MEIRNEDLPVTLQAFDLLNSTEVFIAEQVVNSQADINLFTTRYAGKLIKAKKTTIAEKNTSYIQSNTAKKNTGNNAIIVVILIVLVVLVIYGFSTGWIQEKLKLNI